MIECTDCEGDRDAFRRSVYISSRLQECSRGDVVFDLNVRMVILAHKLGHGYAALKKISNVLGIPSLRLSSYQRHERRMTGK
jgi:hypothetical protein